LKKHLEQILSYVCVAPQCREMPDRLFSPAAVGEMGKVTI